MNNTPVLPSEDHAQFQALLKTLLDEYQPQTATERLLVESMAQHHWLLQRALRLQQDCFLEKELDQKKFALFMRYHAVNQRAFHKCLSDLSKIQNHRMKEARAAEERRLAQYHRPLMHRVKEGDMEAIQIVLETGTKPENLPWHIRKKFGFLPQNPLNLNLPGA